MVKILIKLDLDNTTNVVRYCYPSWMTETMKSKIINLSSATPADIFVDVVVDTDDENEIATIVANGGKQLDPDQYASWVTAKILALSLLQQEEVTDESAI